MKPAIGIDLGTTYSCVGIYRYSRIEIARKKTSETLIPSCVSFYKGSIFVGKGAEDKKIVNPKFTIFDSKRLIGRAYDDESVTADAKNWNFDIENKDGYPVYKIKHKNISHISPQEIASLILVKLKNIAETQLNRKVQGAVVTVPAYFNYDQKTATLEACKKANLNVLKLLNEPTAAGIAYGLHNTIKNKKIVVYDLGGGTFNVSVMEVENKKFKTIAIGGDTHLGGQDFSYILYKYVLDDLKTKLPQINLEDDWAIKARVLNACESAKINLSTKDSTIINIDEIEDDKDYNICITRNIFVELCQKMFKITIDITQHTLVESDCSVNDIDELVLVGGSTRIPHIQTLMSEMFKGKKINKSLNPDEAVAYGAAAEASMLCGNLSPLINGLKVIDVTPLSIGIEIFGGEMDFIVNKNTQLPTKKSRTYYTLQDNQTLIHTQLYEGERPIANKNHFLGSYDYNVPPCFRGIDQIETSVEIDENGLMTVYDNLKKNKKTPRLFVGNEFKMSEKNIQHIIEDAKLNKNDDEYDKNTALKIMYLDNYLYAITLALNKNTLFIGTNNNDYAIVEQEISDLKNLLNDTKVSRIKLENQVRRFQSVVNCLNIRNELKLDYQHDNGA